MENYLQLENIFNECYQLQHLQALASWDEATMMPKGGGKARAQAVATLSGLLHEKQTAPNIDELIDNAKAEKLDQWQQRNLFWINKRYQNATCLPASLVRELSEQSMLCEQAWRQARQENNWQSFAPKLEKVFKLVKEMATIRGEIFQMSAYDVLLDDYCPDFNQATIDPIFAALKSTIPSLIEKVTQHQKQFSIIEPDGNFNIEQQRQLGLNVMQHIGFDFEHGRLDTSDHPFCGGVAEDVRLTTRYRTNEFLSSLMGICHETGHACYEQGLPKDWLSQPVGAAMGMAIHESQSLFIEMPICRSIEFAEFLSPLLNDNFGENKTFSAENIFRLNTKVSPSLIRVDADEVTYPLHVILRYELERDLFNDKLSITDLPEAWDHKMQTYFGLSTLNNDKNGVLQDVHWPSAAFGYFPAYTLGRLIAAQLFNALLKQQPTIMQQISQGDFSTVMSWLNNNIHKKASLLSTDQLLKEATGESLQANYFIDYIEQRYLK